MNIRKVFTEEDQILMQISKPVVEFNNSKIFELLDDLKDTMEFYDGLGLAAVQVGILRRVAVVKFRNNKTYELINPKIVKSSGERKSSEGCLSFPNIMHKTIRPRKVTVVAFDRFGKEFSICGKEVDAQVLCHEIDHLDGILFKQRLAPDEIKFSKIFGF